MREKQINHEHEDRREREERGERGERGERREERGERNLKERRTIRSSMYARGPWSLISAKKTSTCKKRRKKIIMKLMKKIRISQHNK